MAITGTVHSADIGTITSVARDYNGQLCENSGDLYMVGEIVDGGVDEIGVWKSTDGGSNWTRQDISNQPSGEGGSSSGMTSLAWVADGTTIHIVSGSDRYGKSNVQRDIRYHTFSMSSDTFGTSAETVVNQTLEDGAYPVAIYIGVRSDGDVIIVYASQYKDMGTVYEEMVYARRESGSWTTDVTIYSDTAVNQTDMFLVPGASDRMHLIYYDFGTTDTVTRALDSSNNLSGSAPTSLGNLNFTADSNVIAWNDGSQRAAWHAGSSSYHRTTESGSSPFTLGSDESETYDASPAASSDSDAVAVDPSSDDVYVAYSSAGGEQDVYYTSLTDGDPTTNNFATAVEQDNNVTAGNWSKGLVFTHSAGNGGATVFGIVYYDSNLTDTVYTEVTISAGGTDATVEPAAISVPVTLPQSTQSGTASRTPAAISVAITLPTPQVGTSATTTPDPVSVPLTLPQVTRSGGATPTPPAFTIPLTLPQITRTASALRTPDPTLVAITLPQAERQVDKTAPVEPFTVPLTLPQITRTGAANTTPDPVSVVITLPQAEAVTATSATVEPDPIPLPITLPQATRTGDATVTSRQLDPIFVNAYKNAAYNNTFNIDFSAADWKPGDVAVAFAYTNEAGDGSHSGPSGWTQIVQNDDSLGADARWSIWAKELVEGEDETVQWGYSGFDGFEFTVVFLAIYTNVEYPGSWVDGTNWADLSQNGVQDISPGNTTVPGSGTGMRVTFAGKNGGGNESAPSATNYTNRSTHGGDNFAGAIADDLDAGGGDVDNPTWDYTTTGRRTAGAVTLEGGSRFSIQVPVSIALPTAIVVGNATVSPQPVTVPLTLPQAEAITGASATVEPEPVTVPLTLPQSVQSGDANPTPPAFTIPLSLPQADATGTADRLVPAFTIPITLPQATAQTTVVRTPAAITVAITLPQATRTAGATPTPPAFTVPLAVPQVVRTADANATPPAFTVAITLPQAEATGTANPTVEPEPVLVAISLPQHTWQGDALVTSRSDEAFDSGFDEGFSSYGSLIASVRALLPTPTVGVTGGVTAEPDAITVPITLPTSTQSGTATTVPDPVSVAISLPRPEVSVVEIPEPVDVPISLPTPTVTGTAVTVPDPVTVTVTLPQATPVTTGAVTVTPEPVDVAVSLPQSTQTGTASRTPDFVSVTISLPTPGAQGSAVRTPEPTLVAVSLPQTTATGTALTVPDPVLLAITLPQTTPVTTGSATVTPAPVTVAVSLPQSTQSGAAVRVPAPTVVTISLPQASAFEDVSGDTTVTPAPVTIPVSLPQAGRSGDTLRTPAAVAVALSLPQVRVSLPRTVTPQPVPASIALPAAGRSGGAVRTPTPPTVTLTLPTVTLVTAQAATVSPTPVTVTLTLPVPGFVGSIVARRTEGLTRALERVEGRGKAADRLEALVNAGARTEGRNQ